jgi:RNA recognition motif-containing protein
MPTNYKSTAAKRQREIDQKDRAQERDARRAERKARAAQRAESGQIGPGMGEAQSAADDERIVASRAPVAIPKPTGSRIHVGNLSVDTNAEVLRTAFTAAGEVSEVQVVFDRDTGRSRGFAFITMATRPAAKKAIADLDGSIIDDRQIRVAEADDRPPQHRGGRRD